MEINITEKYEVWKNKLLNTGKNNRLISFKETKSSTIKITKPGINELFDSFVIKERELIFPCIDPEDESYNSSNDESNVRTSKSFSNLQKALRRIRNLSKSSIEEQGINVLYLAFGFLEWQESQNSNTNIVSPLILVPASLTIDSITSPYKLSIYEDEIIINPTLSYKLSNDFGLKLPAFNDECDINAYFCSVEDLFSTNKWKIIKEVQLGLFSFLKINMYSDLNNHKDSILSNPVVRAICGDTSGLPEISVEFENYNFDDSEKCQDTFQILDADASQQEAILLANKGISFVLQGPPGTGKSQTISNIIAESLANGKRVLFVSEKMAALDVVYNRLNKSGLSDFCLVLHSYKANKRNVLDQLEVSLELSKTKVKVSDEAIRQLDKLQYDKEILNAYSEQLFRIIEPLHKSVYEANGIIANIEDGGFPSLVFEIENVRQVTFDQLNFYLRLIELYKEKMGPSADYQNENPWKGSSLEYITHEFRQEAEIRFPQLICSLKNSLSELTKDITILSLDNNCSYNFICLIKSVLEIALESTDNIPVEWILRRDLMDLIEEIDSYQQLTINIFKEREIIKKEYSSLQIKFESISNLDKIDEVETQFPDNNIRHLLQNNEYFRYWSKENIQDVIELYEKTKDVSMQILDLSNEILDEYKQDIFELDYANILERIKTEYSSFTKMFNKQYKIDKKSILLCKKEVIKKITDEDMLEIVTRIKTFYELKEYFLENCELLEKYFGHHVKSEKTNFENIEIRITSYKTVVNILDGIKRYNSYLSRLAAKKDVLKKNYGFLYVGIKTDWGNIKKLLEWAIKFKNRISKLHLNNLFIERVCTDQNFKKIMSQCLLDIKKEEKKYKYLLEWAFGLFENQSQFKDESFSELIDKFTKLADNLFRLEEWLDFSTTRRNCISNGLSSFICEIESKSIKKDEVIPAYKKRFFRLWLDSVMPELPQISSFRRSSHEKMIDDFKKLDKLQFEIAKKRIYSRLVNQLPNIDHFISGSSEIGILRHEIHKQRRIMPIRKLFKSIPNLLLSLKPCLMMSPLSVSLFLEADTYEFDIVIFDEASQVCTENAIGAISRGKQVIIAGDSKQLPPTNFFLAKFSDSNDFDSDIDEEEEYDVCESILEEANALNEQTLRWHYRSRHESLIAFSNSKIYKNKLITFPSNIENTKDNGVEYYYVSDGFYDGIGRKGNVPEAKKIAKMIFEHFEHNPQRSLGVIAFGEIQQYAIENELNALRLKNQEFEIFFAENKTEPFFIKNLESVQGDERDTIIFSIGYAKDKNGVFRMNFGPLSKNGGERRLNVAITRAKFNVKLVGSIQPTDIDIDNITTYGPKLLRSYIDFAQNGQTVLDRIITENDVVEHDSPFEEAVYNYLDRKGYKLVTQVGCSGYRIDMAVKHPDISGVYIIGIECDGASYHSARTARERDRLRQDVLENMGWTIYRIWSTDWIKNPAVEGEKLISAIENGIAKYNQKTSLEGNLDFKQFQHCMEVSETGSQDSLVESFVEVEEKQEFDQDNFADIYGFDEIVRLTNDMLIVNSWGRIDAVDYVSKIIDYNYPIHFYVLCRIYLQRHANKKVTIKIQNEVRSILNRLGKKYFMDKDGFIMPADKTKYTDIVIRLPNEREIDYISLLEIQAAILKIADKFIGVTQKDLVQEVARVYGFRRTTQQIYLKIEKAIKALIIQRKIEIVEDRIRVLN